MSHELEAFKTTLGLSDDDFKLEPIDVFQFENNEIYRRALSNYEQYLATIACGGKVRYYETSSMRGDGATHQAVIGPYDRLGGQHDGAAVRLIFAEEVKRPGGPVLHTTDFVLAMEPPYTMSWNQDAVHRALIEGELAVWPFATAAPPRIERATADSPRAAYVALRMGEAYEAEVTDSQSIDVQAARALGKCLFPFTVATEVRLEHLQITHE